MKPLIVIGSGLAGYTLAREWRKLDKESPLVVISADAGDFYSKPMLSNALAKGKTPQALPMASAEAMAQELQASVRNHSEVLAIVPAAQQIQLRDETLDYARLVLAVGAEPIRPPLAGDAVSEVLAVNNLADYARFHERIQQAERIAVIGPGLIGCEFANDISALGKKVVVIGPDAAPLGRLLPPQAGALLRQALEAVGIQWRLGVVVEQVSHGKQGYQLYLSDGSSLEADLVLSAIGLRPNTRLAAAAGLKVQRGIVVDRQLQTSVANIYALGDCAEVSGLVLPFVMPIMHSARALAKTLSGTPTEVSYPAMPVVVKTPAHPVVVSPPAPEAEGSWHEEILEDGVRALFRDADHLLLGFVLTGAMTAQKQVLTKELPPVLP